MLEVEKVSMKNELRAWIDKEVARLDQVLAGEKPETAEPDPVPDDLREALAATSGKEPKG
jgi:hypothetical protein